MHDFPKKIDHESMTYFLAMETWPAAQVQAAAAAAAAAAAQVQAAQ
jgi:hypothetical protein